MANPTCRQIIAEALEENGARGLGDVPEAVEAARGLTRLQAMWSSGVESGLFGRVAEVVAKGDYTAKEGERVFAGGHAITLPTSIDDPDAEGGVRRPRDFAMVQVVDEGVAPKVSLYDAHEAAWTRIDNLTLDDGCPFGCRYRHGLVAALAVSLAPLGGQVGDITGAYAATLRQALSLRQSAPRRNADLEFM